MSQSRNGMRILLNKWGSLEEADFSCLQVVFCVPSYNGHLEWHFSVDGVLWEESEREGGGGK